MALDLRIAICFILIASFVIGSQASNARYFPQEISTSSSQDQPDGYRRHWCCNWWIGWCCHLSPTRLP
ncbi:unnamed protein product [Linum tenue]|uniref:Uncharacterized protein n=1 Tax=Linum tenue TaxID=586396 RepID=A0AAV0MWN9_9ROSI|nr:unnamed protein product [Linum tenue]CAI0450765.1 unnamed protein product [Linum tenue]CAI0450767.1 unnamed protein product [Linum tenue]